MSAGIAPLNAGDLNTPIEVMRAIETDNGKGGFTTSWSVVATPWAEVLGQDGREALIAQAMQGVSTYRIRIRWRAGLLASDQIRLGGIGGTDLNIASITDPSGRHEQLILLASTGDARSTA